MSYDVFLSALDKLELTPEQKEALKAPVKDINTEKGVFGNDLIKLKGEIEDRDNKLLNYKQFTDALAKHNIDVKNADSLAEKLGIQKTQDDTISQLKDLVKEKDNSLKEIQGKLRSFEIEKTILPQFEEALKEYKDKDGNSVKLVSDFIDPLKEDLFKSIESIDEPVIIADKINKVLQEAETKQKDFMDRNGVTFSNTQSHQVPEGSMSPGSGQSRVDATALQKTMRNGRGSIDALASAMQMEINANKQGA